MLVYPHTRTTAFALCLESYSSTDEETGDDAYVMVASVSFVGLHIIFSFACIVLCKRSFALDMSVEGVWFEVWLQV